MKMSINEVSSEDRNTVSPCGIVCLGCDMFRSESLSAAKSLVEIWEGFNMYDVGGTFGLHPLEVQQILEKLKKFIQDRETNGPCKGCYSGAGPSQFCSLSQCVTSKGYWTCAECKDFDPMQEKICPNTDENKQKNPLGARSQAFKLISKRYCFSNIENLKRCQEIGYQAFIKEMKEKVNSGWRTWQDISQENVFMDFFKSRSICLKDGINHHS